MNTLKRAVAATEMVLVFPAALFMTALFVRNLQPQRFEPAHSAQQVVLWYASKPHLGLWIFLIALPLAALLIGGSMLLRGWTGDAQLREAARQIFAAARANLAMLIVAATTLTAGVILAIVAVHVLTD